MVVVVVVFTAVSVVVVVVFTAVSVVVVVVFTAVSVVVVVVTAVLVVVAVPVVVFAVVVATGHGAYCGGRGVKSTVQFAFFASVLHRADGGRSMKAIYYEEHGSTDVLQYGEFSDPEIGSEEVLVDIKAGGLNHLDVWTRKGMPSPEELPHIPGSDGAGVVADVGEDVTRFEEGDRVVVDPNLFCGKCEFCRKGETSLCVDFKMIGEHVRGVHSEQTALHEDNLISLPDDVDFVTAASAPLVFQTAWRMLVTRADIQQNDSVLVHGASGGVGHAAVQIAANEGCEVFATASSEEKLDYASDIGADHLINYEEVDFNDEIKEMTDGRGVDVVVDHIGEATWDGSLSVAARGGTIVTCGATSGISPETNIPKVFWKQLDILGSTMGTPGEMDDVMAKVFDGTFEPHVREVLPMSEIERGHEILEGREGFGSVVVVPDSEYDPDSYE
jgi:NADPH:quinone reductase-like Zn-dependent oxidoreductase